MPTIGDDHTEGIELPPATITRMVAREEAYKVMSQHLDICPFAKMDIEKRLRGIEISLARLIGFMVGSGLLGGTFGAALTKLLPT